MIWRIKFIVQKLIHYFGEDKDQKNLYNLALKAVDIPTDRLEAFPGHLESKGIEIFAIAHNWIDAKFAGEYLKL